MNIPKLRKNKTKKNYHGITLEDDYSWVDQPNILEVLKDPKKLDTEVILVVLPNSEKDLSINFSASDVKNVFLVNFIIL